MRDARGVSVGRSARERREADLFLTDLLGYAPRPRYGEQEAQVCGFFRPDKTARTMAQLRAAIVARCNAEWTAWHTGTTPKPECDVTMFGRLIGYYLAANRNILPDSLTRIQANALATINYTPLLAATAATPAQIAAIRTLLLAGAPGTTAKAIIDGAMSQARQGHDSLGSFRAWSGYHAFVPSARAPQLADIIVQDRRDNIGPSQVRTLPTLPKGAETHGDIVVEVSATSVVTIGGNVADGVRKRRFPRDTNTTSGLLVTTVPQLYGQEDDAGGLPAAPGTSCQALADKSTKRIFALLSLVEDCRDIPSNGGSGSGSGSGSGAARADRQ